METSGPRNDVAPKTASARLNQGPLVGVVGLSHRSASLDVREKVAVATGTGKDELPASLRRALAASGAKEAVLVATCNRVELYADASSEALVRFFIEATGRPREELDRCLYRHDGAEAIGHLFRVTASLDSLVLGEDQILNQVKNAYDAAHQAGTVGQLLHQVFQSAIKSGKRIRRETRIGEHQLSVSSVAVDFVTKVFSDLKSRSVLLVGAGEAARLTLVHLRARGVASVRIANRSLENSKKLAEELGAEAVPMDSLGAEVARADIVLTSVGAPAPLVTEEMVARALKARHGRSLFLLDIAVPRDIEPSVEKLRGVFLYNLDDLQAIVRENYGKRTEDLDLALRLTAEEVERFLGRERHRKLGPLVQQVIAGAHSAASDEVKETLARLNGIDPAARAEVEKLAERLVLRLLHAPLTAIREEARTSEDEGPQRLLERLIENLPKPPPPSPGEPGK